MIHYEVIMSLFRYIFLLMKSDNPKSPAVAAPQVVMRGPFESHGMIDGICSLCSGRIGVYSGQRNIVWHGEHTICQCLSARVVLACVVALRSLELLVQCSAQLCIDHELGIKIVKFIISCVHFLRNLCSHQQFKFIILSLAATVLHTAILDIDHYLQ